jgi:hypothetical protein
MSTERTTTHQASYTPPRTEQQRQNRRQQWRDWAAQQEARQAVGNRISPYKSPRTRDDYGATSVDQVTP